MIAPSIGLGDVSAYNTFWSVVGDTWQGVGAAFMANYVGYFLAFVLAVTVARFIWSYVKGVL